MLRLNFYNSSVNLDYNLFRYLDLFQLHAMKMILCTYTETNKFIFKPDCAFPSGPPHTLHIDTFLSDEFVDESRQKR